MAGPTFQDVIQTLNQYWGNQGCVLIQPLEEDLQAMGPNLMSPRRRNEVIEVARHTIGSQLAEPRNRELLADLPPGDPLKVRRPEGPPSEWPDWRELVPGGAA